MNLLWLFPGDTPERLAKKCRLYQFGIKPKLPFYVLMVSIIEI